MARPSPQTDRVIALLNLLAAEPGRGHSLSDIARSLKVHKVTLYPMLGALTQAGFVIRHPTSKLFQLGASLIPIGEAAAQSLPVLDATRAAIVSLHDELGLPCYASAIAGGAATLIDMAGADTFNEPQMRRGQRLRLSYPLGTSSVAWSDDAAIRQWANLHDDEAIPEDILCTLAFVRETGFAIEYRPTSVDGILKLVKQLSEHVLPQEEQGLLERLGSSIVTREYPLINELVAGRLYDVATLAAPIFNRKSEVEMIITVVMDYAPMSVDQIKAVGSRLLSKTNAVTGLIRGDAAPA